MVVEEEVKMEEAMKEEMEDGVAEEVEGESCIKR